MREPGRISVGEGEREGHTASQTWRPRQMERGLGSESSGSPQSLLVSGVPEGLTLCQGHGTTMAHVPVPRPTERN